MDRAAGRAPTGIEHDAPGGTLLELAGADGGLSWAYRVDPALADLRATWGALGAQGFLKRPDVAGLAPLVAADADARLLVYDTGRALPWAVVRTRLAEHGEAAGARASVELAWRVARVLAAAHVEGGLRGAPVHGGLDPWRIFLLPDGQITLAGYGVLPTAQRLAQGGALRAQALGHAAPELLSDDPAPGTAADLFALGVLAIEALLGEDLIDGTEDERERQAAGGVAERRLYAQRHGLPDEVREVLVRAVKPDRDARWADARAFADRLREVLDSPAVQGATLRQLAGRFLVRAAAPALPGPSDLPDPTSEPLPIAQAAVWIPGPGRRGGPYRAPGAEADEVSQPTDQATAQPEAPVDEGGTAEELPTADAPLQMPEAARPNRAQEPEDQPLVEASPPRSPEPEEEPPVEATELPPAPAEPGAPEQLSGPAPTPSAAPPPAERPAPAAPPSAPAAPMPSSANPMPSSANPMPSSAGPSPAPAAPRAASLGADELPPRRTASKLVRTLSVQGQTTPLKGTLALAKSVAWNVRRLAHQVGGPPVDLEGRPEGVWRLGTSQGLFEEHVALGEVLSEAPLHLHLREATEVRVQLTVAGQTQRVRVSTAVPVRQLEATLRRHHPDVSPRARLALNGRLLDPWQVLDDLLGTDAVLELIG